MLEAIELILTKFTTEVITISLLVFVAVLAFVIFYLIYNKRKFHQLKHQIPASVVKNYLDSIIQNSAALKSSLFRGLEDGLGPGVPSVMPVVDLGAGRSVGAGSGISEEELNQKNAEISRLRNEITQKEKTISDLEKELSALRAAGSPEEGVKEIKRLQDEVAWLRGADSLQRQPDPQGRHQ